MIWTNYYYISITNTLAFQIKKKHIGTLSCYQKNNVDLLSVFGLPFCYLFSYLCFLSFYCLLFFLHCLSSSTAFSITAFFSNPFYCLLLSLVFIYCFLFSSILLHCILHDILLCVWFSNLFSLFLLKNFTISPHYFPLSFFKLNFLYPLLLSKTCSVVSSSDWHIGYLSSKPFLP